jgi:uncharacterized membrane protein
MRADRHLLALLALVLAYTAVFSTLWILRQHALFSYEWEDDAGRNQMIYNTLRGQPFWSSVKGAYFAGHVSLLWAVLAAPSLVHPSIDTACVVLTFGLALTVVPAYLVAREVLRSRGEALVLGIAFLLYAPLHAINLGTLNGVTGAVPLLAWACWAFHRRRFKTFLAFAMGAILCKEDMALTVVFFGLYALLKRRRWFWSVVPIAAGVLWLVLAFEVILPGTVRAEKMKPTSWLIGARESMEARGPGGLGGAVQWILRHPGAAAEKAFAADRGLLFGQLLVPVVLVPLLGPGVLVMAVPALGQLLLHAGPLTLYHRHWVAAPLPFIMWATVQGCANAKRLLGCGVRGRGSGVRTRTEERPLPYLALLTMVLVGCALSNVAPNILGTMNRESPGFPEPPEAMQRAITVYDAVFYRPTERSRNAWALIGRIPRDASVAASGDLLVPLSNRRTLYEFLDGSVPWREAEYFLINADPVFFGAGHYALGITKADLGVHPLDQLPELHRRRVLDLIRRMEAQGEWELLDRRGNIFLFRRRSTSNTQQATSSAERRPSFANMDSRRRGLQLTSAA